MFLVFSSIPWINFAVFLLYAVYVRQGLGHWPRPMSEMVWLPYEPLFEHISEYTFLGALASIPLYPMLLLLRLVLVERKGLQTLQAIFIFGSGIGANWLLYVLDKHKFWDWWLD